MNHDAFSSTDLIHWEKHPNIIAKDEWRIVYHRRIIGDLELGCRVLCMDKLTFSDDEIDPVIMT